MTISTWGWLKNVCENIPDETKIFIEISGVKFALAPKIDKALLTFTKDGVKVGHDCIVLYPYEGESEPPKRITPDDLPKN